MNKTTSRAFDLTGHGRTVAEIHRNLAPGSLNEHAIRYEKDASIAENGALDYLNTRERLYCFDGYAGESPNERYEFDYFAILLFR